MHNYLDLLFTQMNMEDSPETIRKTLKHFLSNSYIHLKPKVHPLGFYSFNLGAMNSEHNLRLHVWDDSITPQNHGLLIHNHMFNFKSLVLIGKVKNLTYSISKDQHKTGTQYEVSYTTDGSRLSKVNTGYAIRLINSVEINEGSYYRVQANEFHESICQQSIFSATLVLTQTVTSVQPSVYSFDDFGGDFNFKREDVSDEKLTTICTKLINLLD